MTESDFCEISFPTDEEEFEESIVDMKDQLKSLIFDENNKFKTEYFLRGYDSAYRIVSSWFEDIRNFQNLHETIDKETYLDIRYLLYDKIDDKTRKHYEALVLEKSIPNNLAKVERQLYEHLWFLKFCHDVVFELRPYDEFFQKGEYGIEDSNRWIDDWAAYDNDSLFTLCCDVHDYLYEEKNPDFAWFAKTFIEQLDLPNSFFIYFEERK